MFILLPIDFELKKKKVSVVIVQMNELWRGQLNTALGRVVEELGLISAL